MHNHWYRIDQRYTEAFLEAQQAEGGTVRQIRHGVDRDGNAFAVYFVTKPRN